VIAELSREELAWAAEVKIWSVLFKVEEEPPSGAWSAVREHVLPRVARLRYLLSGVPSTVQESALAAGALPDAERNRAFGEAALAMHATLAMIASVVDNPS
jgi:hypothetical protein